MAINFNTYGTSSVLNQSVQNLKQQLTVLQSQLTTGEKSTTYAGMGVNEGFAIAARQQLSDISAFTDTQSNINTTIGVANDALQSLVDIGNTVLNGANSSSTALSSTGQSIAQQTAGSQFSSMLGILNTQAGNNYLFSGSAINTPPVASYNAIINGTTTQAGLTQVIAERQQADLGTSNLSGAVVSSPPSPTPTVQVAGANAPYGFTLTGISATGSAVAVTNPTGSPATGSVALTNQPVSGDKINFTFKLPDGTTQQIQLTASGLSSPPAGSYYIGANATAAATNLNAALTSAVGAIPIGLGRVAITSPTTTSVQVAQDTTPFGLKLNSISVTPAAGTSGTAESVSPPTGTPPTESVTLNSQPSNGDQFNFTFNLPDGTTQQIQLTATTTNPPPKGSFLIDPSGSVATTTGNLQTALTGAVYTLANTSLVAASAVQAGNDFFSAGTATGNAGKDAQGVTLAPGTALSSAGSPAPSSSLSSGFAAGDTITVNGTPITFVNSGATGNQLNLVGPPPASVQTLLSKIDSITGTSTPSTISNTTGAITLHTDDAPDLKITSSNPAALAALGFGPTISGTLAPLRVAAGPPPTLVSGTPANTVSWYTGNQGPAGSARASLTARVDPTVAVQYGVQADESAIRSQLQTLAVFAAFTASPTGTNSAAQITALSQSVTQNLSALPGQQTIPDIQADLATAQTTIQDAAARQTQSQSTLQNLIDTTENVSPDQVASEILSLQTSLQASYQTTSMLSQLTLTKYLPTG